MKIAVIGAGYVGLVSAGCLAEFGHEVTCVDNDEGKIASLTQGRIPIYEPGLQELVERNISCERLLFSSDLPSAVRNARVVFVAVGTPSRRGDGFADLSYVYRAARQIAAAIDGFAVIVTKSTVPIGTGDEVERIIRETKPGSEFAVVSNPEFLREGAAIADFMHPDRIVIGTEDARARAVMEEVYRPVLSQAVLAIWTSRPSAELIKYTANAFLATKITFINEIADLCEKVGADVSDVAHGIGLDNRIGPRFLNAGPGYGGSCFPKDTTALIQTAQACQTPLRIVETVAAVNEQRKRAMGRKVIAACGGSVRGAPIGVLGLTFKPDTDDMRESPSLSIIQVLKDAGARITAFDPQGTAQARQLLSDVRFADDCYRCADGAHALVIVTEWEEFRQLDLARLRSLMHKPVLVDLRNLFSADEAERLGFAYTGIGKTRCPVYGSLAPADAA